MIVTLNNPWDARKLLAKTNELEKFPVRRKFISKSLIYEERQVERTLLPKCIELNDSGIQRLQRKIKICIRMEMKSKLEEMIENIPS